MIIVRQKILICHCRSSLSHFNHVHNWWYHHADHASTRTPQESIDTSVYHNPVIKKQLSASEPHKLTEELTEQQEYDRVCSFNKDLLEENAELEDHLATEQQQHQMTRDQLNDTQTQLKLHLEESSTLRDRVQVMEYDLMVSMNQLKTLREEKAQVQQKLKLFLQVEAEHQTRVKEVSDSSGDETVRNDAPAEKMEIIKTEVVKLQQIIRQRESPAITFWYSFDFLKKAILNLVENIGEMNG